MRLILASQSPYRAALLQRAGLVFSAVSSAVDETEIVGHTVSETAMRRARAKAQSVAAKERGALVIGADQTLELGGRGLRKVDTSDEARLILQEISGKTHYLHSAYALAVSPEEKLETKVVIERLVTVPMAMRCLTEQEIAEYLETGEWRGSVGCYKVEGQGRRLFERLEASEDAIIGLPMVPLLEDLRAHLIGSIAGKDFPQDNAHSEAFSPYTYSVPKE